MLSWLYDKNVSIKTKIFFKWCLMIDNPCRFTGPAVPEIQDTWFSTCSAELHALPYYGELKSITNYKLEAIAALQEKL